MQFQQTQCALTPDTLFCKALAASQVDLYREVEGKVCAQASISADYETYVEQYAGFKQGKCTDLGYNHLDGTKTEEIPIVGNITVAMYDNVLGLNGDEQVTLYQISGDECGQSTLAKKYETYAQDFDKDLVEGTCAEQGYTVEDGSKDITVPFIGTIHTAEFKKPSLGDDPQVTLYEITGAECGQSTLAQKYEKYAKEFDSKLQDGTCAAQGYTVPDGSKDITVPFIGTIHTAQFKKSAERAAADAKTYYELAGEVLCGETTLDKDLEQYAEKFVHLTEGTCASQGFTHEDGEKDIKIPFVGDIKLALYTKTEEMQGTADKNVTLFQVKGTECGQITIATKYEPYVEKMDKELKEGTCAKAGYDHLDKKEEKDIPMIGDVEIDFYSKSKKLQEEDAVTLFQVEGPICAEASVPKQFEWAVEKVDKKLKEGSCSKQGYSQAEGEKEMKVPFVGDIKFSLYLKDKKNENLQQMI